MQLVLYLIYQWIFAVYTVQVMYSVTYFVVIMVIFQEVVYFKLLIPLTSQCPLWSFELQLIHLHFVTFYFFSCDDDFFVQFLSVLKGKLLLSRALPMFNTVRLLVLITYVSVNVHHHYTLCHANGPCSQLGVFRFPPWWHANQEHHTNSWQDQDSNPDLWMCSPVC